MSDLTLRDHAAPSTFRSVSLGTLVKPLWRQRKVEGAVGPLGMLTALAVTWIGGTVIVLLLLNYLMSVDAIGTAIA
ncbi:MAG TPA: hypothetical protein VE861_05715, partial [Gemmatimonadaceae bacterium]|nr:hypothetical protein [Gemmatimonadaceae bacterium]